MYDIQECQQHLDQLYLDCWNTDVLYKKGKRLERWKVYLYWSIFFIHWGLKLAT